MAITLDEFLKRNSSENISKSLMKKLQLVEAEILGRQNNIKEAEYIIDSNKINLSTISEATCISRKTFYNNDLLRSFVLDNSTTDISDKDEIKRLSNKLKEANNKINKLICKDIDIENIKYQNNKLEDELKRAYERIRLLEKEYEKLLDKSKNHSILKEGILN